MIQKKLIYDYDFFYLLKKLKVKKFNIFQNYLIKKILKTETINSNLIKCLLNDNYEVKKIEKFLKKIDNYDKNFVCKVSLLFYQNNSIIKNELKIRASKTSNYRELLFVFEIFLELEHNQRNSLVLKNILKRLEKLKTIFTINDIEIFKYLVKKKNHLNFETIKLVCDDSQKGFFDGPNWK